MLKETLKKHFLIFILLIIILIIQGFSLFVENDIWWDAAVYLGMGKYIYSSGHAGLWEPVRPLVWPLILGFFWKIGLDEILFGKIVIILSGALVVFLTYLIALNVFNKKTAVLSSLFLAFWPVFFLYNSVLQTEIISLFFLMLGIYILISKKDTSDISDNINALALAGLFFGFAVMTRFFLIFLVLPIYLYLLYYIIKTKKRVEIIIRDMLISTLFFAVPVIIYLAVNLFLYNNPIFPFLQQAFMTNYTGWVFHQPWHFYFVQLIKENFLCIFAPVGIVFIIKAFILSQRKEDKRTLITAIFILGFIPFAIAAHKEMRILIPLLPFLSILISYSIIFIFKYFKKCFSNSLIVILVLIWVIYTIPQLHFNNYEDNLDVFYEIIQQVPEKQAVWISNPAFIAYTNKKADELIYYPLYNTERINQLKKNIGKANIVLINTCDLLPCPTADNLCNAEHKDLLSLFESNFEILRYKKQGDCEYYIFT